MTIEQHISQISSESLLAQVIDNASDGIYFVDRSQNITFWSQGAAKLTGYSTSDMLGTRGWMNIVNHRADQSSAHAMSRAIEEGQAREAQVTLRRRDGKVVTVYSRLAPIRDTGGEIIGAVEIFSDNTPNMELLQKLHQLHDLAMQDPMTGLANRRLGEMTLQSRFQEWTRFQWRFGVLFLDVDRFKTVNDQHGHNAGDMVLCELAGRLRDNLRSFDTACRWGGDEFVVILGHVQDDQVSIVANKLLATLCEAPYSASGQGIRIGLSIGAVVVRDGDTAAGIIERADEKMYESKRRGGRCVSTQTPLSA